MLIEEKYMDRALQLASCGAGFVSPNPMVGAVITARGGIIGEGWHRIFGGPHAEPNAIASVAPDRRHLLREATMYVTLEPCSHYGKTPPCAMLLAETGIPRVVVAVTDPNPRVAGRGIEILREAGAEVAVGVREKEARFLNRRFLTAQTLKRPYIQLKWAETAGGRMAGDDGAPLRISTPATLVAMHRERALADAIMVGTGTLLADNPSLDCRLWPRRRDPLRVSFRSPRLEGRERALRFFRDDNFLLLDPTLSLEENMRILFRDHGVNSLMVEGGPHLLASFRDSGLVDEQRREIR